ncbi:hypothetical protein Vdis_1090 [Vulcanisaeta distributa DSM 14429]|uniref:Uncharacterized protein n=2 Tax=Vulcanisaeta distributa TaxID=164451 RepID=E1QQI3_VULDI|nr:hypothetical protein Vdis_1090 [Vulcanisaeta distributa DSM 14429]
MLSQNHAAGDFPMISIGISEVVGATILLVIAVALSLLIFGYFYGYLESLGYSLANALSGSCEFSIMSTAFNTTGSSITSISIALYNYGNKPCDISGVYVLNESTVYQIAVANNCITNPLARLGPGQVLMLNYSNLNIPYNTNYLVKVVSCDGFTAEEGLGQ